MAYNKGLKFKSVYVCKAVRVLAGRSREGFDWGWYLDYPLEEKTFQQVGKVGKPLEPMKADESTKCD